MRDDVKTNVKVNVDEFGQSVEKRRYPKYQDSVSKKDEMFAKGKRRTTSWTTNTCTSFGSNDLHSCRKVAKMGGSGGRVGYRRYREKKKRMARAKGKRHV